MDKASLYEEMKDNKHHGFDYGEWPIRYYLKGMVGLSVISTFVGIGLCQYGVGVIPGIIVGTSIAFGIYYRTMNDTKKFVDAMTASN